MDIKKIKGVTLDETYAKLGVTNQHISYWRNYPASTLVKCRIKHNTIYRAKKLFGLTDIEAENLANKAGLSLCCFDENNVAPSINSAFAKHFTTLLSCCPMKVYELCGAAQISDRMFRYIRQGTHLRKGTVLALLISMDQDLHNIQTALKKAGYVLTHSLPEDLVVLWLLENKLLSGTAHNRIILLNETLDYLGLPLLTGKSS